MKKSMLLPFISLGCGLYLYCQNNWIKKHYITYETKDYQDFLHGFTILLISDLHSKRFGKNQIDLVRQTKNLNPDLILLAGDILDGRNPDISPCLEYVNEAVKIAPVYFVTGNHEEKVDPKGYFIYCLKKIGVHCLLNRTEQIFYQNTSFYLTGVRDKQQNKEFHKKLKTLVKPKGFQILISHRPEYFLEYQKAGYDLVFSGHAHGGQIRLPLVGGVFAPGQGVFPKFTSGQYKLLNTTMIVSRGLGKSIFPFRIGNRPEIVAVTFV